MRLLKDVPLKLHSTMRLGGNASYATEAFSKDDLVEAAAWGFEHNLPVRLIGMGSNIVWSDKGFNGLLVVNHIPGFKKISEDDMGAVYEIGSGENWDAIVGKTAELGLYGIECLSLIPGTTGATPVQNVGAYGQDISQVLVSLEAYDQQEKAFVILHAEDCDFGYRTSRFKTVDSGRFLISSVTLKLQKSAPDSLWSHTLKDYLDIHHISERDSVTIRKAIIAIREAKMPDPAKVANSGSFFANPIITSKHLEDIRSRYPDMPSWEVGDDAHKLAAAWLIETAGFKGKLDEETGFSTWKNQALVIVNESATSTNDLLKFQQKIADKIYELFQIKLQREPELLP